MIPEKINNLLKELQGEIESSKEISESEKDVIEE